MELRRLSWDSPASLIEKLIKYEAVHDIRSWADLKNRLTATAAATASSTPAAQRAADFCGSGAGRQIRPASRRCWTNPRPPSISPAPHGDFYSISNTQTGLRGVSFGDSLIKHVVETLTREFRASHLCHAVAHSGLRGWLFQERGAMLTAWTTSAARTGPGRGFEPPQATHFLAAVDNLADLDAKSPVRQMLLECAATTSPAKWWTATGGCRGPLSPGQRRAGRTAELGGRPVCQGGLKQSYGLMVNYLYD